MIIRPTLHPLATGLVCGLVLLAGLAFKPISTQAETVQVPVGQQGGDKQHIQRPRTGMKQEQVRAQFGNPFNWSDPVGDPPITAWTYADFVVYFEYDRVIHSVLRHTAQAAASNNEQRNEALRVLSESEQ